MGSYPFAMPLHGQSSCTCRPSDIGIGAPREKPAQAAKAFDPVSGDLDGFPSLLQYRPILLMMQFADRGFPAFTWRDPAGVWIDSKRILLMRRLVAVAGLLVAGLSSVVVAADEPLLK